MTPLIITTFNQQSSIKSKSEPQQQKLSTTLNPYQWFQIPSRIIRFFQVTCLNFQKHIHLTSNIWFPKNSMGIYNFTTWRYIFVQLLLVRNLFLYLKSPKIHYKFPPNFVQVHQFQELKIPVLIQFRISKIFYQNIHFTPLFSLIFIPNFSKIRQYGMRFRWYNLFRKKLRILEEHLSNLM